MTRRLTLAPALLAVFAGALVIASCDAGYDGQRFENQPPRTTLAVRDTNLAYNLCTQTPQGGVICSEDDELFTSTVFVSWNGVDPDGFVVGYDLRYYDESQRPGPEELWQNTTRRDTVLLLPIPAGAQTAQVVFEVRAIDNEGLKDPNPARTVFPIINSPPAIRLVPAELPPDTTWTIFSFGWQATDPDGPDDIAAVEVALNDSEEFVALPPNSTFATFVVTDAQPGDTEASARVYLGRGFSSTEIFLPGVRLDQDNTIRVRSRDRTGATSPTAVYPAPESEQAWFVRQPKSDVLLINDFRSPRQSETMPYHRETLSSYMGDASFDEWNLSEPFIAGVYSSALPRVASPTLRETLKLWTYIYWVADSVTDAVQGNNLALAANFLDGFLDQGGRLFVQVPFTTPPAGEVEFDNPAYDLLPAESIVTRPGTTVPPSLAIPNGGAISPGDAVPGTGRQLPPLRSERLIFTLPYTMNFATAVPLYLGQFVDRDNQNAPWQGASFVASMDRDRRVGLLALQIYSRNRFNVIGLDGDESAPGRAIHYILEGLTFPGQPAL
jgi:hypothetical protein